MTTAVRILAVDSSDREACVCFFENEALVHHVYGDTSIAHSEGLLTLIDQVVGHVGGLQHVDQFAVGAGPGSFTGIRIGLSTVQALAWSLQKPVRVFSSLRAMASRSHRDTSAVFVNAFQEMVFAGWYQRGEWNEDLTHPEKWLERHLIEVDKNAGFTVAGSGVSAYRARLEARLRILGASDWVTLEPTARVSPEAIYEAFHEMAPAPAHEIRARYLKASHAEMKLQATLASQIAK